MGAPRHLPSANFLATLACAAAALAGIPAALGPAHRSAAVAAPGAIEFLSDVLRDWRRAKTRGDVDVATRTALARRAFAVADVARGRERYEALRFVAGLDAQAESAELTLARDRALERAIREFIDDGDLMGEFVLRVLGDGARDRELRARVFAASQSPAVRAACEFQAIEATLDRALEGEDIGARTRDELLLVLGRIAERYGDAKHPLSAKTWGATCAAHASAARDLVLLGEPAPAIAGAALEGGELALSRLGGKAVLLCFWGDWCAPCRDLYPRQRELAARLSSRAFTVFGVNSDPDLATARAAAKQYGLAWPNVWDGELGTGGANAARWRVRGWPTWYLIDAQGIVRRRWRGAPSAEDLDVALAAWVPTAR